MFYEDMQIGSVTELGSTEFTREAIIAYARRFDPRVLAAVRRDAPLAASGLHVASAMMRRLVETRTALREAMAARANPCRSSGYLPGSRECAGHTPSGRAMSFHIRCRRFPSGRPRNRNGGLSATAFAASINEERMC